MGGSSDPEPAGWAAFGGLLVVLLRLAFTFPYVGLAALSALALSGRDRLAAHGYAARLGELGHPVADPLPPLEELRERFLARLPDPGGVVRQPDVYAAEGWLVLGSRVVCLATLAASSVVLTGAFAASWRYVLPWAVGRAEATPWLGLPLVAVAAAGAWAAAGWLAAGAFALTAAVGPVRWFSDWAVGQANRELWGGVHSPEPAHGSDSH